MNIKRSYIKFSKDDLIRLQKIALSEHEDFYIRNPHLRTEYYNSLIGICLCQGGALHYCYPDVGIGVKDIDIWHFYTWSSKSTFPYRARKVDMNGYRGIPLDYMKRVIPRYLFEETCEKTIMNWMFQRDTKSKKLLLTKAIVGIYPNDICGKILWKPELTEELYKFYGVEKKLEVLEEGGF